MTSGLSIGLTAALLACGASTAVAQTAPAAQPPQPRTYALSVWAAEKGLPPGDVFAINQDAEGYLWLGTPTGLLRFDGSRFVTWASLNEKEPLPSGPVHALVSVHDGSLWVGMGGGGGVLKIDRGHLTRFTREEGAVRAPSSSSMVSSARRSAAGDLAPMQSRGTSSRYSRM